MAYLDYTGLSHFLDKLKTIFVPLTQKGANNGVATLDGTGKVPSSQLPAMDYIPTNQKGANSGVASLDNTGKVPIAQLPTLLDDVIEGYYYNGAFYEENTHTTVIAGAAGKIYTSLDTNKIYRYNGSTYDEIANTDVMTGATSSAAGRQGLAPAPAAGKNEQYLKGDATWDSPSLSELGLSVNNGQIEVTFQVEEDDD